MKKSKLVEVLSTFRARDFREFGEYIRSPFFNKNEDLVLLFEYLRKQAPGFADAKLERTFVWSKLFPGKAFDEKETGYLMSFLLKHIEQYLGLAVYQQDTYLQRVYTLIALQDRDLEKHLAQARRTLLDDLDHDPVRNSTHFYYRFRLAQIDAREFLKKRQRAFDEHVQEAANSLDDFYLIEKLRLSCELANRKNILSAAYDIRLVDEVLAYLRNYDLSGKPALNIYYQLLHILIGEDAEASFQRLRALLLQFPGIFTPDQSREVYSYAENFCISMVKRGREEYLRELFGLYRSSLDGGTILEEGYLSPWKFKNIVSTALRLGEFDWTGKFIPQYLSVIQPDFQETAQAYNMANYYYHTRRYDQALRSLMQVEFTDVFYSLDTRKMMLRIYFEQGETEALHSLVAAFRVYLKRNKLISTGNREAYAHFVSLTFGLYKAETPAAIRKVQQDIRERNPLVDREWLLEMAEQKAAAAE